MSASLAHIATILHLDKFDNLFWHFYRPSLAGVSLECVLGVCF